MDKAELRQAVIAQRNALDLDVQAAKSAVICARLVELMESSLACCGANAPLPSMPPWVPRSTQPRLPPRPSRVAGV